MHLSEKSRLSLGSSWMKVIQYNEKNDTYTHLKNRKTLEDAKKLEDYSIETQLSVNIYDNWISQFY